MRHHFVFFVHICGLCTITILCNGIMETLHLLELTHQSHPVYIPVSRISDNWICRSRLSEDSSPSLETTDGCQTLCYTPTTVALKYIPKSNLWCHSRFIRLENRHPIIRNMVTVQIWLDYQPFTSLISLNYHSFIGYKWNISKIQLKYKGGADSPLSWKYNWELAVASSHVNSRLLMYVMP